ncbi:MAG: flagellar hook-associated protein 3 [Gammaproteobacteria bacterium RBG_16_57_12]|nr:MAG: flagellar hook-associated protein 3 [Gammaproteobacteria bacterium RBG_16_57_12]
MRISTSLMQQLGINAITEQQAKLSETQMQLATGKRILSAADDPSAVSVITGLRQSLETTEKYQSNADTGISRLNVEESTLSGTIDILQRVRVLALQGNNDSQTNETRQYIANEIRELLSQVVGVANTKDQNGDYLFSGNQVRTQPFSQLASGTFIYQGDEGQRHVQIGSERQIATSDPGKGIFMEVRNGNGTFVTRANSANTGTGTINAGYVSGSFVPDINGYELTFLQPIVNGPITYEVRDNGGAGAIIASGNYSSGVNISFNGAVVAVEGVPANNDKFTIKMSSNQSVFETLDNLAATLETKTTSDASKALFHNNMGAAITDIDRALENIESYRARIGARLNTIDSQKDVNETVMLQIKGSISSLEDLDFAEAVGRLNLGLTGLQAAQQSYTRIQGLSLFNYM